MEREADKAVSLVYQSPYFTDIDFVVSNRTTSVDFPRTRNNERAIQLAGLPQGTSLYAYNIHNVIYYRDGVQLFSGKATLLSLSATSQKWSFTWGNTKAFETMLDARLRDLQTTSADDYVPYENDSPKRASYYYPAGWNTNNVWCDKGAGKGMRPMMPVADVINRIQSKYGVSFTFPSDSRPFDKYIIPLVSHVGDEVSAKTQGVQLQAYFASTDEVRGYRYLSKEGDNLGALAVEDGMVSLEGLKRIAVHIQAGFQVNMPIELRGSTTAFVRICGITETGNYTILATVPTSESSILSTGMYTYTVEQDYQMTFNIDNDLNKKVAIVIGQSTRGAEALDRITIRTASKINIYDPDYEQVNFGTGAIYPLWRNLPDWTVSDLIKNLMKLEGLYAYSNEKDKIVFVDIADLDSNRTRAKDWSDKVMGEPAEMAATFNNLAQRNWLRWEQDDTVIGDYDAYMPTESNVLALDNDLITLDFAPSDNRIAVWRQDDEGGYDREDVEPRIMIKAGDTISFNALKGQNVIDTQYKTYASIIRHPKTIKASFNLTTIDLLQYDPSVPIYVKQWGHYYAVIKLTTKDNGKADAELLQLGEAQRYTITN
jgi:hypothetical protein